ncbi:hypothetical protein [Pseudomonas japonica]|uniref:hypothetical protein n=1 Tax=Pseudomonas japonica TaxID=256466 RepID=UPI0015E3E0A4|nr:hypothetical protein [Pseudomonas japonica]MBA1245267.1 hypothetical protein [Pseudomonas japonica]
MGKMGGVGSIGESIAEDMQAGQNAMQAGMNEMLANLQASIARIGSENQVAEDVPVFATMAPEKCQLEMR